MSFTKEQLTKAKQAKSVEELLTLAKENGMELTEEEAAKHFAEWHKEGELSDDELNNVSGGCGGSNVPSKVNVDSANPLCPSCGERLYFVTDQTGDGMVRAYLSDDDGTYDLFACSGCGKKYRRHWNGDSWTKN